MTTVNKGLGLNNPVSKVAYHEITSGDMKNLRLAALNNMLLQLTEAVNGLAGYNGIVILNSGLQLNGDLDLHGFSVLNSTGAANFADSEVPSGLINSSNKIFMLAHIPNPVTSLQFFVNGLLQGRGSDYTLNGKQIALVVAPSPGDSMVSWYRF